MARVFAFKAHNVRWQPKPGAALQTYSFPAGEERDVPDDLARLVTGEHPQKLRLLGDNEAPPDLHGGAYADTSMGDSPADRMLSQDTEPQPPEKGELCGRPKRDGSPCQNVKPCRWHRWIK